MERFASTKTITQLALETLERKISSNRFVLEDEIKNHKEAMKRIEYRMNQIQIAQEIMSGKMGFVLCSQGSDIKSGFTAFEEVVGMVGNIGFTVSLEPMKLFSGNELYRVNPNGMMELIGAKCDTLD